MALIERLMGWDDVEGQPSRKIADHTFWAANVQRIAGAMTRAEILALLEFDAADTAEYDALAAQAAGMTAVQQLAFLNKIHSACLLAAKKYPNYDTPAALRAKLGLM